MSNTPRSWRPRSSLSTKEKTGPGDATTTYTDAYQARVVRGVNAVRRITAPVVGPARPLNADDLMATATKRSDLHDFGDPAFEEPLRVLVEAYENEAGLHPVGRTLTRLLFVRTLCRRLQLVDVVRRDAALADLPVTRPVIIVGLPRTGTTLLYNLLACNSFGRPLLGWEGFDPVNGGDQARQKFDKRPRRYARQVRLIDYFAPSARQVHELSIDGPEEDLPLLQRTFVSHGFLMMANLPSYESWLWAQPQDVFANAYRFHRLQLQVLHSQRPTSPAGHWILKSPIHLYGLLGLLATYSDACIVHTHRDLKEAVASTCSLFAVVRSICSDAVDRLVIGRQAVVWGERLVDRILELRARIPAERVIDVHYTDLMNAPVATLNRIHQYFRLPVESDTEARARSYLAARTQHRHGVHRYSLEQFGILPAEVDRLAGPYNERFSPRGVGES